MPCGIVCHSTRESTVGLNRLDKQFHGTLISHSDKGDGVHLKRPKCFWE